MKEKTLKTLEFYKVIEQLELRSASEIGKERIRKIRPLTDIEMINDRLEETQEALELLLKRSAPPLYGISSVKYELSRLEIGGNLSPKGLLKISDLLRVSRELTNYINNNESDRDTKYPFMEELISRLSTFKYIEDSINKAIISEEEIADDASSELKRIRRSKVNKNSLIRSKLDSMVNNQNTQKYLQDNIVTIRDGRYVLPVKAQNKKDIKGLVHDTSSSGQTMFIEPMAVVELNNELRELDIEEREEIERILRELSDKVRDKTREIKINEETLSIVDFIFAKGKFALDLEANKPKLNNKGYLNLKKARHPLLDPKKVVPIDIYLGKDFTSLVITGPNTGGKTVTLKTVGLCTLMAQSGLFIPCDIGSEIAVFDQIFADIGDEQSIEQSLSTFSSHMTNIVDILNEFKENSLILFDELGAGTDPTEGAALAMSILDYLLNKNVRTIATTHYSQLKLYALTTDNVSNASVEFDVETLRPTYKLSIGVPGKSNAFDISKRLGLSDNIINSAKLLISSEDIEFEDALKVIQEDKKAIEENKYKAEKLREEIELLKEELKVANMKIEKDRQMVIQKANLEARDILRKAKEESDLLISEIRDMKKNLKAVDEQRMHDAQRFIGEAVKKADSNVSKDVLNVQSSKIPKNLKIGESVEILSLNQVGQVLTLPDDDNNVTVQVGIMKVNVPLDTLRRSESGSEKKVKAKSKKYISIKSKNVKDEIDLRGRNIDEAILELEKYIDDVYIGGLKTAYIIHGKGTGALRDGLQSYFKNHRLIKSFRPGEYGEGGTGVTVISIK